MNCEEVLSASLTIVASQSSFVHKFFVVSTMTIILPATFKFAARGAWRALLQRSNAHMAPQKVATAMAGVAALMASLVNTHSKAQCCGIAGVVSRDDDFDAR